MCPNSWKNSSINNTTEVAKPAFNWAENRTTFEQQSEMNEVYIIFLNKGAAHYKLVWYTCIKG